MQRLLFSVLFLLVFIACGNSVQAHPHVFVDASVTLQFDSNGLTGFQEEWFFDEMFSEMIMEDYDKNKNRRFEKSEIKKIKSEAFDNLKEYGYFHSVSVNGKFIDVDSVADFDVRMSNNKISYRFNVKFPLKITKTKQTVEFSLSDPTIYTDIAIKSDSPKFTGKTKLHDITHKRVNGKDKSSPVMQESFLISLKSK